MDRNSRLIFSSMLIIGLLFLSVHSATANDIALFQTIYDIDYIAAGVGNMRNVGTGTIALSGVSGTVIKAYLYWHGPTNSLDPNANANVFVNGNAVSGTNIGFSNDNCWGYANSQAYRADVTSLVASTGNGNYVLTGFGSGSVNTNGASLIVFFDDGVSSNNRDVVMFDGNDSNINNSYDAFGWNITLSGIDYTTGTAYMGLHVGDGQYYTDDTLILNGSVLDPGPQIFDGTSVPPGNDTFLGLWDIKYYDVTSYLSPGLNTLIMTTGVAGDCLSLVLAVVDLPAGAAPGKQISIAPEQAVNCTGKEHTITATIIDDTGAPSQGTAVDFEIMSGPNAGIVFSNTTNSMGEVSFSYTGSTAGSDTITACFTNENNLQQCATATKDWVVCNKPPDTSKAAPTISCIWPPNHEFVNVGIIGVTDPDGDPVTITVTGITSDEPTATIKGAGGIKHAPDAMGLGTNIAQLRAERSGTSNGRIYQISFVADDGKGGITAGSVLVGVPKSVAKKGCNAIDDGQKYDATK
jgi:hypothetical protein